MPKSRGKLLNLTLLKSDGSEMAAIRSARYMSLYKTTKHSIIYKAEVVDVAYDLASFPSYSVQSGVFLYNPAASEIMTRPENARELPKWAQRIGFAIYGDFWMFGSAFWLPCVDVAPFSTWDQDRERIDQACEMLQTGFYLEHSLPREPRRFFSKNPDDLVMGRLIFG